MTTNFSHCASHIRTCQHGCARATAGLLAAGILVLVTAGSASADQVSTLAGTGTAGFSGDGGPALSADLFLPHAVAVAPDGTIYFADIANFRIRRISPSGVIDTIAGNGVVDLSGDGGPATQASLSNVVAIAYDATTHRLYLADTSNSRVRRVDLTTGTIDSPAEVAFPQGIAVDAAGTVYVAETLHCRLLAIEALTGRVTTFAGTSGSCMHAGDGGPAAAATFYLPTQLAIDAAGHLFVMEGDGFTAFPRVRRIDAATGIVTTVAGGGTVRPGVGPATSMHLDILKAITTDDAPGGATRLFIAEEFQIFVVNLATGELSPFAGTGVSDFQDGPASDAMFNNIGGLAYGPNGAVLVGDANNNRIRVISPGADEIQLPEIAVAPLSHDFGDLAVGSSETTIVTVSNVGSQPLTVSGIAMASGSSPAFDIMSAPPVPAVVAAGGTVDVSVRFTAIAVGLANATLNISSDDLDESVVQVTLSGLGVQQPSTPSAQMAELLAFFDASVNGGTLQGNGPGTSAAGRLSALRNMIAAASDLIEHGLIGEACQQLLDAYRRADGQPQPPDFVAGAARGELAQRIQSIRTSLGCY